MPLTVHPLTVSRKTIGDVIVTVPIHSTEPGTVTASAPGCTFPDGETVVIAGTRTWRNAMRFGEYLQIPGVGQSRDDVTFCCEFWGPDMARAYGDGAVSFPFLNARTDAAQRVNWSIGHQILKNSANELWYLVWRYVQSKDSATGIAIHQSGAVSTQVLTGIVRLIITLSGTQILFYYTTGASPDTTGTRLTTTGTMGGVENLIIAGSGALTKYTSLLSQAERQGFMASGALPASPEFSYLGTAEINPAAPKLWDSGPNNGAGDNQVFNYDLTAATIASWPTAGGRSGAYTDAPGDPVVPASSIRVSIPPGVASPVMLSLSRPRQGVPSRASEAEKTETTTGTITIVDIPAVVHVGPPQIVSARLHENPVAYCHITTDRPGTVTITCDRTIIDFPATVVVDASLEATIEGAILKGGDCDVTGAM